MHKRCQWITKTFTNSHVIRLVTTNQTTMTVFNYTTTNNNIGLQEREAYFHYTVNSANHRIANHWLAEYGNIVQIYHSFLETKIYQIDAWELIYKIVKTYLTVPQWLRTWLSHISLPYCCWYCCRVSNMVIRADPCPVRPYYTFYRRNRVALLYLQLYKMWLRET